MCDAVDNCPTTYNPDQKNSNIHAEIAWGAKKTRGIHLGDACHPAPTPVATFSETYGPAAQAIVRDRFT